MAEATIDPVQVQTEPRISPIAADMGTIVTRAARRFGSKTALIAGDRTLTYRALDDLCDRVAGGLHEIGVRPGDRVSLYSPNRWEWVVAYHAALRAGAVVNPINVMLTAEEVAFVLNDCGAAAIFTSGEKAEVIAGMTRALPTLRRVISFDPAGGGVTGFEDLLNGPAVAPEIPRPAPTDLSTIGYTSGTTGHPKGAMQSHRAVFLNTAAVFTVHTRTDRDVMLNAPRSSALSPPIPRWPWSPSARCPTKPTASWPAPTWYSVPAPLPPRPRSSSTAGHTWPPTSCPARSGSCPTCPRPPPAR
jgi:acyl-CoA synthetase (AMP-forming)/AMP-acid ligase II